jgi:hypothetical protein
VALIASDRDAVEFACGLCVDVSGSEAGVAAATEHSAVVERVGVEWIGEGVDGDYVVDGVGFCSTYCAGGVVF